MLMVGSASRLLQAPNSLLVIDTDPERQKMLCVFAMELWPGIRTETAATFTQAEEGLLRTRVDAVLVAGTPVDDAPLNFLSNVRIILPDLLWIQVASKVPEGKLPLISVIVEFDLAQGPAALKRVLREALAARVQVANSPVAA